MKFSMGTFAEGMLRGGAAYQQYQEGNPITEATTVATIATTQKPVPPAVRAFVVCIKFKEVLGKILHDSDWKTALAVTGYTEKISLCRKTIVFRTFLINSANFYQLQRKCLAEYGEDFYTVEVILSKEEPKNLDAKFWTPVRIKSGGVLGRAHFRISNGGRNETVAVDRSHWMVEQAFYKPPYCGTSTVELLQLDKLQKEVLRQVFNAKCQENSQIAEKTPQRRLELPENTIIR
uniref:Uncharacterized protein n=1 Tax=Romanomermis culicivorax TaxID=13658 RepID=A0A915K3J1_ROMCU